ncbi:MAG: hypothetical protein J0L86_05345 [Flavobacteriales bacterium]|nr:hypothetical protein [Flavobacteriales bacterium]
MILDINEITYYIIKWRLDFFLDLFFIIIFTIVAIISFIAYHNHKKFLVENVTFHTIESLYELFNKLSNSEKDWRLSHLFCVTDDNYMKTCNEIVASFQNITDVNQLKVNLIEYRLREQKMIIDILLFYEQVYFQYKHSKDLRLRKEFLRVIDHYFKDKLLINPRIINAILESSVGKELHLEEESFISLTDRFEEKLKKFDLSIDKSGPFNFELYPAKQDSMYSINNKIKYSEFKDLLKHNKN